LFSASILNWTTKYPDDFKLAFEKAMATVQGVLRLTVQCGGGELQLVRSRQELENPTVLVHAQLVTL
jgi:pyridoxal/pyridoxine/pyridoxamine kinase